MNRTVWGAALLLVLAVAVVFRFADRNGPEPIGEELLATGVSLYPVVRSGFVRTVRAEGYLRAVQATPVTVPMAIEGVQRIDWIASNGKTIRADEEILRFDPGELERQLEDGRDDLAIARIKIREAIRKSELSHSNLASDLILATEEMSVAETFAPQDPRIFSRHEILDSEIEIRSARDRAENLQSRIDAVIHQGREEKEILEIEKYKAELSVRRAEDGLHSLVVRAPHEGMFVLGRNWRGEAPQLGDEVWPGQKLGEIPDPSRMQATVYVLEADASGLAPGQRVTLVVESRPGGEYPARVDRVDALAKPRYWNVPVQFFEVVVVPETTDPEIMKPGQRVQAEIFIEETPDALTIPPQAVFQEDGASWVFRRSGKRFERVAVRLGSRSLSRVLVLEGLVEGDRIALRNPRRHRREIFRAGGSSGVGATP